MAFYFICMLHLANEKGLVLEPPTDSADSAAAGGGAATAPLPLLGDFAVRRDPTA